MNLSEVKKLKDGDEVEFYQSFLPFTVGKKYKVRETSIGIYVRDDNGLWHPLTMQFELNRHFR